MKVRQGFVSNSSTSSFIVRGVLMTTEKLKEIVSKLASNPEEANDDLSTALNRLKLDGYNNEYDDESTVVGDHITSIDNGCIEELNIEELLPTKNDDLKERLMTLGIKKPIIKTYWIAT